MTVKAHPGAVLKEKFIASVGISVRSLSNRLNVEHETLQDFIAGKKSLNKALALKLAKCFETTPEYWVKLQIEHDRSKRKI
ncbi:HigA family addiction module antitoxin [Temperatibacter marinus]|uniref:HigA family addiction module antitoxin n=1 Tax=Temperatibacter marinus TaxID=1456591 RepID=A0AA52H948_9PROT|nr:HigA family addiction module antitoxin [Temperatibacter marinus]WND02514.1 HigA family addiction module antitoxin [Temperatibacter marinus]